MALAFIYLMASTVSHHFDAQSESRLRMKQVSYGTLICMYATVLYIAAAVALHTAPGEFEHPVQKSGPHSWPMPILAGHALMQAWELPSEELCAEEHRELLAMPQPPSYTAGSDSIAASQASKCIACNVRTTLVQAHAMRTAVV